MSAPSNGAPKVLLVCAGLDHAWRGFESFARECFDTLRDDPEVQLRLVKGSGEAGDRERTLRTLRRDRRAALALGRVLHREPFRFEHAAFALRLQPELLRVKPDVVYFSEWDTGRGLAALRKATRQRYALVMSNGSLADHGFDHLDLVQQHTQPALDAVLARGADPARQTLLPVAFEMDTDWKPVGDEESKALREELALPVDRPVIISVAALNRYHKRLDYLIEEVARLPEPRPFVLLVGQSEPETPGIRELAQKLLGDDGHSIRSVPKADVPDLLRASDAFVLASLGEGLPRALIEGMGQGLPCMAHDYDVARYALGDHGRFGDFTEPGALSTLIEKDRPRWGDTESAVERHRTVYERFSWDRLRPEYLALFHRAAGTEPQPAQ